MAISITVSSICLKKRGLTAHIGFGLVSILQCLHVTAMLDGRKKTIGLVVLFRRIFFGDRFCERLVIVCNTEPDIGLAAVVGKPVHAPLEPIIGYDGIVIETFTIHYLVQPLQSLPAATV